VIKRTPIVPPHVASTYNTETITHEPLKTLEEIRNTISNNKENREEIRDIEEK
jgi:hypothetical protein